MKREGGRYIVDPKSGKPKLVQRTKPAQAPGMEAPVSGSPDTVPEAAPVAAPAKAGTSTGKDD